MNLAEIALFLIALLFLILVVFRLVSAPLKLTLKLLLNTAIGFFALILLDLFSPLLGLHLGVNLTNAFIVGLLGLPGFVLLLLMQWVFLL